MSNLENADGVRGHQIADGRGFSLPMPLLPYRMKHSNAYRSAGGGVAMRHYSFEIWKELARVLGIRGPEQDRVAEAKRLYDVAHKAREDDGEYRSKVGVIIQDFEERYGLGPDGMGIVFI